MGRFFVLCSYPHEIVVPGKVLYPTPRVFGFFVGLGNRSVEGRWLETAMVLLPCRNLETPKCLVRVASVPVSIPILLQPAPSFVWGNTLYAWNSTAKEYHSMLKLVMPFPIKTPGAIAGLLP